MRMSINTAANNLIAGQKVNRKYAYKLAKVACKYKYHGGTDIRNLANAMHKIDKKFFLLAS